MQPIEIPDRDLHLPDGQTFRRVHFGVHQSEYAPLTAVVLGGEMRPVLSRWEPSEEERWAITRGAAIDLAVLTFGAPLQPVLLGVQGTTYVSSVLIPPREVMRHALAQWDEGRP